MEMGKNILSEFEGDNWAESASGNVASQGFTTIWQKVNLRDAPPSKRFVSGQWFCSAAISSKSTGSAAAVAPTVPVEGGVVETENPQQHFSNQANIIAVH
jgi:hypothetical protein